MMESNPPQPGVLVVSLDFELFWGVRDKRSLESYRAHLDGVPQAVESLLEIFERFGIHATWATVGFLFHADADSLKKHLPVVEPAYEDASLSPYGYLRRGENLEERHHFASGLLDQIQGTPGQEIASHSYSHYYCLERGQTEAAFRSDMEQAVRVAKERGVRFRSMVFPRNQCNRDYLPVLRELGVESYRGNERSWMYEARKTESHGAWPRACRLADAYVDLSGHHTYSRESCREEPLLNIPSSRFLRPFHPKLAFLDPLRLRRINRSMSHAAARGEVFHLWWHPHNFGTYRKENLRFLEGILQHYRTLAQTRGMVSRNMGELAGELRSERV